MDSSNDTNLRFECLKHYFDDSEFDFKPTEGGVNNFTTYLTTKDGAKYIIRIYNNGNNSKRVEFEHKVIMQLLDIKLSFETPRPLLSKDGKTHVLLSTGTEGAVFHLIKGTLPRINDAPLIKNIGRATAELLDALSKVTLDVEVITPPYYELYLVHHAITRDKFLEEAKSNKFDHVREPTDYLVAEILELEQKIDSYHKLNLPVQLIHGDFHHDNMLTEGYEVTAALDFEFASKDWRAMDVAITLAKFAAEKEPMPMFEAFIEGFAEVGDLNENEVKAIPSLIILRIVSNFVYFVGRYLVKEDSVETCTKKMQTYCNRVKWLKQNDEKIQEFMAKKLAEKKDKSSK
jgi:homoserine kinase type II